MSATPEDASRADLAARTAIAAQLAFVLTDATDPEEPLIWVNEGFCRLTGYSPDEVLGRNCRFLQGTGTEKRVVSELEDDLRAGRTSTVTLLNYRRDRTPFWNRMVISPVRDADGNITHHLGIQTDATDQVMGERARAAELELQQQTTERLDLLARVGDALTERLDLADAAAAVADIATPEMSTWGFVALTDERGAVRRVHVAVADPVRVPLARALERLDTGWLHATMPQVGAALSSARDDILLPSAIDPERVAALEAPAQRELLAALGTGSALIVPLWARDRVLGVLGFVHERRTGFDARRVVTGAHLARRAGLALDNVRLYLAERDSALALQHRLLPRPTPAPGLDISASYLPSDRLAEVGGDWFDVLTLPDSSVALMIGDVVGHDMVAAASMGQVSSLLRARAWSGRPPGEVVASLAALLQHIGASDVATCIYLRWCTAHDGADVTYANAGHPQPMVRLPGGTVQRLAVADCLPVGLADGTGPVPQHEVHLPSGSTLVLYTDGLVERRGESLRDGLDRLEKTLAGAPDGTAEQVRDHLLASIAGDRLEDDVCLLVVRCP